MSPRQPTLCPTPLAELKPTQITVGFREVAEKRKKFREQTEEHGEEFLGRHMIPTVLGPKKRHYVIDNHHLALALLKDGVKSVLVTVAVDLSSLSRGSFWRYLDNKSWCHPYDEEGARTGFDAIPGSLDKMKDDPYRSLAGDLRHEGGFAKDTTLFSEFLWADYLRQRIKPKALAKDYQGALKRAVALAAAKEANFLPGWCGPDPID
ncbi:MAG: chromosome partitioning protein ParB [Caulobacteraceae bacterium]|nr:chromosome partitioning protein ParB [Caulobacteraceae bacterium]